MIRCWSLIMMVTVIAKLAHSDEVVLPTEQDFAISKVLDRLAHRIEPESVGKPERASQYIEFFRSELANDSRLFAFDVSSKARNDGRIEVSGFVEFPETRTALIQFLTTLGLAVDDRLETLPAAGLGKQIFGLVKSPHSVCYDRPSGRQRPENDCLIGEPLYLLREENGHLLAHSGEGYLGYIPSKDVLRIDAAGFSKYLAGPRARIQSDQQLAGMTIPAGSALKWVSTEGDEVTAEVPTGERVKLPAKLCDVNSQPPANIEKIIARGQQLLGTNYLWGGKTSEGVDCSGLVQLSYNAAGIHLPRDAYQQFYVGRLSATRWHTAGMRRGDTLYFLGQDGKIRHTAIYLGDNRFLQATIPVVRINSFDPTARDYSERLHREFAFAKRPVD